MSVLPIVIAPDPVLKAAAKPVAAVDDRIRTLMANMLETMYEAPGIGLAAPQIGVSERVIVVDVSARSDQPHPLKMANPEVVWVSNEKSVMDEGCLSLPDISVDVERPEQVRVRYQDEHGETLEIEADGLLSKCLQHEIDHLDGVLITDRLSLLRRNMAMRKLKKFKQQLAEDAAAETA